MWRLQRSSWPASSYRRYLFVRILYIQFTYVGSVLPTRLQYNLNTWNLQTNREMRCSLSMPSQLQSRTEDGACYQQLNMLTHMQSGMRARAMIDLLDFRIAEALPEIYILRRPKGVVVQDHQTSRLQAKGRKPALLIKPTGQRW